MNDHIPVLTKEILDYLNPKSNENFIDATINGGGHTALILKRNKPKGKVLGVEADFELYQKLKLEIMEIRNPKSEIQNRLILANDSFKNLKKIIKEKCPGLEGNISGILFDLGMSSWQLEKSKRGFSFKKNEILDMRFDASQGLRAVDIINQWQEKEIQEVILEYGEERWARKIAKEIIRERKIKPIIETVRLANIIKRCVPANYERGRIHPATRTFQALRITVNQEIESLKEVLPQAIEVLKPKGRIAVISFHSLEDRIVKNFFRERSKENQIKIITKKLISPSFEEIRNNPRARSAKLRVAEKLAY